MAEDEFDNAMVKAGSALIGSVDPSGGVAAALVSHALTRMSVESAWRGAALDLWLEVLIEEGDERREQYKEAEDEFRRHHHILGWLKDELAEVLGRIADLEAVALALIAQGEKLVRLRPGPEMRGYLAAALRNSLRRRDLFSPSWVRRLTAILETLGAEHIELMWRIARASRSGTIDQTRDWWMRLQFGDDGVVASELASHGLVTIPVAFSGPAGVQRGTGQISKVALKLLMFIDPEATPPDTSGETSTIWP